MITLRLLHSASMILILEHEVMKKIYYLKFSFIHVNFMYVTYQWYCPLLLCSLSGFLWSDVSQTSSICITDEFVRNVKFLGPFPTVS